MSDFFLPFFSLILIFASICSLGYLLLKIVNQNNYCYLTSVFGYSLIVIIINFFYFVVNFKTELIINILIFLFLIVTLFNLIFYKEKFIKNIISNIAIVIPIFLIFTLLATMYGEQYYVFRGNAWDYFGYITGANLSSENTYPQIVNLSGIMNSENSNMYFDRAISWFNAFPVFSTVYGTFIKAINFNIFFEFYLFKVFSLSIYFSSVFVFFKNFLKLNYFNTFFISLVFVLSFYSLFIYEIDSLRQLSTLSIFFAFLVLFKNINAQKYFEFNKLILISLLMSTLYLIYSELLFFISFFIFISLFVFKSYKNLFNLKNCKKLLLSLIIFLIFVSPSVLIMYEVMISQFLFGATLKPLWYVYFGSYFFGRISPDLINQEFISFISSQLNSELNIFEFLTIMFEGLNKYEFTYVFLNIIPSFFGFYFLTDIPINNNFIFIYRISLLIFSIYLIFIYIKNMKYIFQSRDPSILFLKSLNIVFFLVFFLFIFQAKIFAIIKLILYFFIIFFIPIFVKLETRKIRYFLCILVFVFPIYKFSTFNDGITRYDSFPSIQLTDTKQKYSWKFENMKFTNCTVVSINIRDNITNNKYHSPENILNYFKYLHLVLNLQDIKFKFGENKNTLINLNIPKKFKNCEINEEKIN